VNILTLQAVLENFNKDEETRSVLGLFYQAYNKYVRSLLLEDIYSRGIQLIILLCVFCVAFSSVQYSFLFRRCVVAINHAGRYKSELFPRRVVQYIKVSLHNCASLRNQFKLPLI
jgi:hypothetical protein